MKPKTARKASRSVTDTETGIRYRSLYAAGVATGHLVDKDGRKNTFVIYEVMKAFPGRFLVDGDPPAKVESAIEGEIVPSSRVEVPVGHWPVCPIKTRFGSNYERIVVKFDDDCPSTIPCVVTEPFEDNPPKLLPEGDEFSWPADWGPDDVRLHNEEATERWGKRLSENEGRPPRTPMYTPVVKQGSVCGGCSRGGSVPLDQAADPQKRSIKRRR